MKLSMIAAVAINNVIGRTNADRTQDIPWRLKSDMRYFKQITLGKPIIMGRKTFESMGSKVLKGRVNIVISRAVKEGSTVAAVRHTPQGDTTYGIDPEGPFWVNNLKEAFLVANRYIGAFDGPDREYTNVWTASPQGEGVVHQPEQREPNTEIIVIGGGEIYKEAIDYCNRMYITQVYKEAVGDIYFPTFEYEWTETSRSRHNANEENECHFDFVIYERHGKIPKPFLIPMP